MTAVDLFGADAPRVYTKDMMLREIDRELAQRRHVYERLIAEGKLTPRAAVARNECLYAIRGVILNAALP